MTQLPPHPPTRSRAPLGPHPLVEVAGLHPTPSPHGHTPTYMPACSHTHTHMHACTQTHICQARSPPQHGDLPSPPPDLYLAPRGQPSRWLTVIHCRQGRALTRWPWWAPSWLTNLETLNRGSRVLPASLPPLAGALGEGQERRKPMNELNELGARGLGQGVGSSKPGPWELSLLRSPGCGGLLAG